MARKQRRIDWNAIKTEYVTGNMGQRALIKKYKLASADVSKHSKKEGWVKAREDYRAKAQAKAMQKAVNKRADELASVLDSAYKIKDTINNAVSDPLQFNRYLVTEGSKGGEFHTEEVIKDKIDTKAIREMTQALKAVESLIRSLNNIPTEAEAQRLKIEREKFELEKEKWEREKNFYQDSNDGNTGVIFMPEVGEEE
jgi:hypothetical protein